MAATQYPPMSMPPAGTYPWPQQPQQPGYYPQQPNYYPPQQPYSPPQQSFYPPPQFQQPYPQAPPNYQQPTPYPPSNTPPQSQGWPSHAGEYMGPGVHYGNYYDDDSPDYNNPPEPQYGIPESHRMEHGSQHEGHHRNQSRDRSDPRFVFPDNNGGQQQPGPNGEGERGLGATVLGGGAGAFLGHKLEHGALGTIGGLAIGAIAANAFEHHEKKKKEERKESRAFDEGYEDGERRHSRSRDIDDDYYGEENRSHSRDVDDDYYAQDRYEEDYEPPRHHHHHHRDYEDESYRPDDYYEEDSFDRRGNYYDRRDDY